MSERAEPAAAQPAPAAHAPALRVPHPLVLLTLFILAAAALTWILPAGAFDRRDDPVTGRSVVVAGTYHAVEATPVGPFDALVSISRGMAEAADVIALVFLVGAAWWVVERTGVLGRGVDALARGLAGKRLLVIPACCVVFGAGGALVQMQEELVAFAPVLVLLVRRFGFDRLTAVAMSIGAAIVGAWFSPINPFMVGIAQKLAQLPLLSGWELRLPLLAAALAIWIWVTMRHAGRCAPEPPDPEAVPVVEPASRRGGLDGRDAVILGLVLITFVVYVVGVLAWDWGFDQMSGAFFLMGVVAGIIGGLGARGTAEAFVEGFRAMAYAALLIGFARAISVVLADGKVIDTIVQGMFAPISAIPGALAALTMTVLHTALHVPVPSTSGQAVLTMPILIPLSDLLGLSRQAMVLAYQYGVGPAEALSPTNGALMAMLAATGVRYDAWVRFAGKWVLLLFALGASGILLAIGLGLR